MPTHKRLPVNPSAAARAGVTDNEQLDTRARQLARELILATGARRKAVLAELKANRQRRRTSIQ